MPTYRNANELAHGFMYAPHDADGKTGTTDAFYFRAGVLYSYATPIARHVMNRRGETALLVTSQGYSVTTQTKHLSALRRAVPGMVTMFYVPEVAEGGRNRHRFATMAEFHKHNCQSYDDRAADARDRATRATRYRRSLETEAARLIVEKYDYRRFFGLAVSQARYNAAYRLLGELRQAADAEMYAAIEQRQRRDAETYAERIPRWIAGERVGISSAPDIYLRLAKDGEHVETSRGAFVPLRAAEAVYMAWATENYDSLPGRKCGAFTINKANAAGLTIGCHVLYGEELLRFGKVMGWDRRHAHYKPGTREQHRERARAE